MDVKQKLCHGRWMLEFYHEEVVQHRSGENINKVANDSFKNDKGK